MNSRLREVLDGITCLEPAEHDRALDDLLLALTTIQRRTERHEDPPPTQPCKGCGRPMVKAVMLDETGKAVKFPPLDPKPPVYRIVSVTEGVTIVERDKRALVSHFATCPDARRREEVMKRQGALDFGGEPPPLNELDRKYREWRDANQEPFRLFLRFARQAVTAERRFSTRTLVSRARWEWTIELRRVDEFRINDHISPYLARDIIRRMPEAEAYLELRTIRADAETQ